MHIETKLNRRKKQGLFRMREPMRNRLGARHLCADQWLLSFINNDYLGLACHPKVMQALINGIQHYGVGSSASQLLGGYYDIHLELEEKLAEFIGVERVILFSSGFMANLAILTALINKKDIIFSDQYSHASLIDGALYSVGQLRRFKHQDLQDLEELLRIKNTYSYNKWLVSEGVFSMEGDLSPLPKIIELSQQYSCRIILDDAHGFGVLGKAGRGSIELHQIQAQSFSIIMGTFGKALGTMGAFVGGKSQIIEFLIQYARSFIYTTALPPAMASATLASLNIVQSEYWRRTYLSEIIGYFQQKAKDQEFLFPDSITPIQVLKFKGQHKVVRIHRLLKQNNILVGCIRSPTVPLNKERLRINLSVNHSFQDIDLLIDTLNKIRDANRELFSSL